MCRCTPHPHKRHVRVQKYICMDITLSPSPLSLSLSFWLIGLHIKHKEYILLLPLAISQPVTYFLHSVVFISFLLLLFNTTINKKYQSKKKMCCSEARISSIFYVILECIILLVIVFGTAFDQFRLSTADSNATVTAQFESTFNDGSCVTLWGAKQKCYSGGYSLNGTKAFWDNCPARQRLFRAAEVLSIVSVGLVAISVVLGFFFLCCCACMRYFLFVLSLLSFVSLCVTWAIMAGSYSKAQDTDATVAASLLDALTCDAMKSQNFRYGAGFGLLVAGWGLQFFNCIIILLPC
ncbi:amastin-like protein [Strigomonas culicis]|uniref:Amastin-like protein n=1 Tax=Strigomonas culicis TaxID=28005 RepID=S9U7K9_9TRYP|nr:amastin-like protein [Strigomonas culicis]|eukprot:EPY24888.1 amastin-like protein [Strigomonas culicis]